ncbi:5-(carboxyamino)imidazole ribonucleotide synthase [soil metagenome]
MKKIGILGGGQLGRMLLQAGANYPVQISVLEKESNCPSAFFTNDLTTGDITNFDDVYNFGKHLDAVAIEIESVNIDALLQLQNEGVAVYPKPEALTVINSKILQKQFYYKHEIPTSEFVITNHSDEIKHHPNLIPAVHKIASGGYDGKGVAIINSIDEASKGFNAPAVLERKVTIKKEIAIIAAVSNTGEMIIYPPVEMIFDQDLNLLDYQISPADLPENILWRAEAITRTVVKNLNSPGIFAVEMFVDDKNDVYVNETAPRVHNSGHHTIEANYSSQFDMLWRIMLNYPLGNTAPIINAAMVNIIGAEGYSGKPMYDGLDKVLQLQNVFVHLYGKPLTKPGKKMGHVTILSNERQELIHTAHKIKHTLRVISDTSGT